MLNQPAGELSEDNLNNQNPVDARVPPQQRSPSRSDPYARTYQQQGNGDASRDPQRNIVIDNDGFDRGVFPPMSKTLAPGFKRTHFIWYITVIEIIMFMIELIYGQVVHGAAFDADNADGGPGTDTMIDLGAKDTNLIQEGELYRLFVPIVLHGGIMHICFNLFFQNNLCHRYEERWGMYNTIMIYLGSGFGGNLLSAVVLTHTVSVGASGSLMGCLAAALAWILLNYEIGNIPLVNRQVDPRLPQNMLAVEAGSIICLIILNLFYGLMTVDSHIDNYAHLGGLISGFCIGLFILPREGTIQSLKNPLIPGFSFAILCLIWTSLLYQLFVVLK